MSVHVTMNLKEAFMMRDGIEGVTPTSVIDLITKGGVKGTRIRITDADTGELIDDRENKVLISGAQMTVCKQWGIDAEVNFPNYNDAMNLDHTLDYETIQPKNEPYICLWCIGTDGCGGKPNDVYPVRYTQRLEPRDMLPFRYLDIDADLNEDLRKVYFGRRIDPNNSERIEYFFKNFDTEPQLHLRYLDGTQITENIYNVQSSQLAECYVETRLRVTRQDFRDYFEQVTGWEEARINTLSLLYAWYDIDENDEKKLVYYQQVLPFSKLNFSNIWLVDLTKAVDFNYQIFY